MCRSGMCAHGCLGHDNFDNEGAHDCLDELDDKGIGAIRSVLGRVARAEVDDAQAAIAAVKVVAAAHGIVDRVGSPICSRCGWTSTGRKIEHEHAELVRSRSRRSARTEKTNLSATPTRATTVATTWMMLAVAARPSRACARAPSSAGSGMARRSELENRQADRAAPGRTRSACA